MNTLNSSVNSQKSLTQTSILRNKFEELSTSKTISLRSIASVFDIDTDVIQSAILRFCPNEQIRWFFRGINQEREMWEGVPIWRETDLLNNDERLWKAIAFSMINLIVSDLCYATRKIPNFKGEK